MWVAYTYLLLNHDSVQMYTSFILFNYHRWLKSFPGREGQLAIRRIGRDRTGWDGLISSEMGEEVRMNMYACLIVNTFNLIMTNGFG